MSDIPLWNYVIYSVTGQVYHDPAFIVHGALKASSSKEAEEAALLLLSGHMLEEPHETDAYQIRAAVAGAEYQPGHFLVDVIFQRG